MTVSSLKRKAVRAVRTWDTFSFNSLSIIAEPIGKSTLVSPRRYREASHSLHSLVIATQAAYPNSAQMERYFDLAVTALIRFAPLRSAELTDRLHEQVVCFYGCILELLAAMMGKKQAAESKQTRAAQMHGAKAHRIDMAVKIWGGRIRDSLERLAVTSPEAYTALGLHKEDWTVFALPNEIIRLR
jgi:hypothetical protein